MKKQKLYLTVIGLVLVFLIIEAGLVVHSQIQGNEQQDDPPTEVQVNLGDVCINQS